MEYNGFLAELNMIKEKNPVLFQLEHDEIANDSIIKQYEYYYGVSFPNSYKRVIKTLGGGYVGYIILFSLDCNSLYDLKKNVPLEMINEYKMLPVVDLETGDYIGFETDGKECTENLMMWMHDVHSVKSINTGFYELIINLGLKNIQDIIS